MTSEINLRHPKVISSNLEVVFISNETWKIPLENYDIESRRLDQIFITYLFAVKDVF